MNDSIDLAPREPRSVLGTLDELLRQPRAGLARARAGAPVRQWALRVFAGTLCCWALYGAGSDGMSLESNFMSCTNVAAGQNCR